MLSVRTNIPLSNEEYHTINREIMPVMRSDMDALKRSGIVCSS
jgi:hypothetical protein